MIFFLYIQCSLRKKKDSFSKFTPNVSVVIMLNCVCISRYMLLPHTFLSYNFISIATQKIDIFKQNIVFPKTKKVLDVF